MPNPENRATAGDLAQATIQNLPTGFKAEGNSIICPSGLRWTLTQGDGFDLSLRGNTIHVPYEEFMVVDQYALHSRMPDGSQVVGSQTTKAT